MTSRRPDVPPAALRVRPTPRAYSRAVLRYEDASCLYVAGLLGVAPSRVVVQTGVESRYKFLVAGGFFRKQYGQSYYDMPLGSDSRAEQKPMPEEQPISGQQAFAFYPRATFGLRALAKVVDLLVLSVLQLALFILLAVLDATGGVGGGVTVALLLVYTLGAVGYFGFFSTRGRQTYGYWLTGLLVVTAQGRSIGVCRALLRAFVDFACLFLIGYGVGLLDYLPAAATRSRRAGHDLLTQTMVVRVAPARKISLAACATVSFFAPFAIVFLIVRPFLLQAFYMPSSSMVPALQVNDRFLVNKLVYRLHPIRHEDIIVFVAPNKAAAGSPDFAKRVAGLPGDTVRTTRGRVLVGGQEFNHAAVRDALGHAGVFGAAAMSEAFVDQADHHVKFVPMGVLADGTLVPESRLAEMLTQRPNTRVTVVPGRTWRNGEPLDEPLLAEDPDYDLRFSGGRSFLHRYDTETLRDEYLSENQEITKADYDQGCTVPEDHIPLGQLVVFGDNRNDSNDSAYWGYLPEKTVEGKATLLFAPRWHRLH